ncbi:MAG: energy-coupling factor ABC transporter ATP-binding protein [Firmicutes bacterium]|nr:energy-coupling factor ABC transporter ATP-binding protein [Bacillota bacterium]
MIEFIDVDFHYPNGFHALRNIRCSIPSGSTVAIIGNNGSGKTTLIKQVNGLLNPSGGVVRVDGISVASKPLSFWAQHVGYLFQDPNQQIFNHTVLDETLFGPRQIGMEKEEALRNALESLEQVGLMHCQQNHPYDLTLPQRKLVGLAGILAMKPAVLVLDEPTMGQDAQGLERINAIIRIHAQRGGTVLAVCHDMDFVASSFDRIVVMNQGAILADGEVSSVFANQNVMRQADLIPPELGAIGEACGLGAGAYTPMEFVSRIAACTYPNMKEGSHHG